MIRRALIVGNWKMNGSQASIPGLVKGIVAGTVTLADVDVVLCPSYVYLLLVGELVGGSKIRVGAQDLNQALDGAFTGEVSGNMVRDCDCQYVIVGHSERRTLHGETDPWVARKYRQALDAGLTPILCVGENLEERESGLTETTVGRQLAAVLEDVGPTGVDRGVIAYEPVWAIGTGRTASTSQAGEVHAFLREEIASADRSVAENVRIIYGGSVNADNAAALFALPDVDGGLVGGASLKAEEFVNICKAAN